MVLSFTLLILLCSLILQGRSLDVSDVVFQDELTSRGDSLCSLGYPSNVNITEISLEQFLLQWEPPIITDTNSSSTNADFIGYQVLYWQAASTTLAAVNLMSSATNFSTNRLNLTGFTTYFFSVRGECEGDGGGERQYGPASNGLRIKTPSRGPDVAPVIVNYTTPYNRSHSWLQLCWMGIEDDQWNGQDQTYIVSVYDITPDSENQLRIPVQSDSRSMYYLAIGNLQDSHLYLMYVHAVSSGGRGPQSNAVYVQIVFPPTNTPSPEPSELTWHFYLYTIPALIVLAILIAVCLLCTKLCLNRSRKNVAYVRDINKNLEDGTIVSSRFKPSERFEMIRMSQQNRPLPPNPQTPTPSATSVNARLIIKDYSPPFDHSYPEYPHHPSYPPPPHPYHHPIDMEMEQRMRSVSVTSPHYPTLSQPLSDMSSVTPSSVLFNEVVPTSGGRYPSNRSPVSPGNANPYEVPNESESGHHSVSPPGHAHSRRPHTANAMMSSQPAFYPSSVHHHHGNSRTPPMTQSNVELFQLNRAPPVPPHRSNTITGTVGGATRLDEGDYSEIPDSPEDEKSQGPHISPISSSEGPYNSYSDIPNAVSPAQHLGCDAKSSPAHSSSSESISSFSTDSQSTSPARGVRRGTGGASSLSYQGGRDSNSIPRCASQSNRGPPLESHQEGSSNVFSSSQEQSTNPYLSPTSVKSSSNSDSTPRTTPPTQ